MLVINSNSNWENVYSNQMLEYKYPDFQSLLIWLSNRPSLWLWDWNLHEDTVEQTAFTYKWINFAWSSIPLEDPKYRLESSWSARGFVFTKTQNGVPTNWWSWTDSNQTRILRYLLQWEIEEWKIIWKHIFWKFNFYSHKSWNPWWWSSSAAITFSFTYSLKIAVKILHSDWTITQIWEQTIDLWSSSWTWAWSGANWTTPNSQFVYDIETNWIVAQTGDKVFVEFTFNWSWHMRSTNQYQYWYSWECQINFWQDNSLTTIDEVGGWTTNFQPCPCQISIE